ncbi:MAG: SDR family oxidoreductase [Vicingaceae bacterium]
MKILLTGATGYIGKRLLPALVADGHEVLCCVRDKTRFNPPVALHPSITVLELDLLDPESLRIIPSDIDIAYYLVHSMSSSSDYMTLERQSAQNIREVLKRTKVKQVIYLSGIINDESLSEHLASRKAVEDELGKGTFHLTTFRAGIIIGSGSASFEIIRDLVEKLPVMVAPKWLKTKCQPISVSDVVNYLNKAILNEKTYDHSFDIGGPDILSYREMLMGFASNRRLKRLIINVPIMTPRISSYWLYFITSTSYKLASALVDSMKVEVICRKSNINEILDIEPLTYKESLNRTMAAIDANNIVSSWKDSLISGRFESNISQFLNVPTYGCFIDHRELQMKDEKATVSRIWTIGGENGWYFANSLWRIRGFIDKLMGGVGLRRGRTSPNKINSGDSIDFWRVLYADKKEGRLLLFAEMKLPGEAWLEFKIENSVLKQTATFRPRGLSGRLYWYLLLPVHNIIFKGMIKRIAL